jgi:hypothetical protein
LPLPVEKYVPVPFGCSTDQETPLNQALHPLTGFSAKGLVGDVQAVYRKEFECTLHSEIMFEQNQGAFKKKISKVEFERGMRFAVLYSLFRPFVDGVYQFHKLFTKQQRDFPAGKMSRIVEIFEQFQCMVNRILCPYFYRRDLPIALDCLFVTFKQITGNHTVEKCLVRILRMVGALAPCVQFEKGKFSERQKVIERYVGGRKNDFTAGQ